MMSLLYCKIRKFFLTFIFLCAIFTIKADGASFHKADSLFFVGDFFESAIEYERLIFEYDDIEVHRHALIKKASALKMDGRFHAAIRDLNRISIRHPGDSLLPDRTWHLAICYFLIDNHNEVIATIDMYAFALQDHSVLADLYIIKALSHNFLFEHEMAYMAIEKALEINPENYQAINELWMNIAENKDLPKYKNPEKAHNLSMIIPGTGHWYAGSPGEGAVSFLLNASALSFGVWQVWYGYFFTGYVVGVTLLERFHTGGKKRAETLAELRNHKNAAGLNQRLLDQLDITLQLQ